MESPKPAGRRFTPARIALFALIVVGIVIYNLNSRDPTPPASGDSFNGTVPATQPTGTLRVATFNMAGGVGGEDNRLDLTRTAAAIHGYDLVGLEEVHGHTLFTTKDQAQILGETLTLPWLFAPVETRWGRDDFGNGAITDLPIVHWQRIPISNAGADTNRNLLLLHLKYRDKPLNVIVTHLGRHVDHNAELASVLDLFQSLEKPAILLADLNTEPDDKQRTRLIAMANAIGIDMKEKDAGLDWVLARGMRAVHWGLTNNGASDHSLFWAELDLDQEK